MTIKYTVYYATKSSFKQEELTAIFDSCQLVGKDQQLVKASDAFDIRPVDVRTDEPLERDLAAMVKHKAKSAFRSLLAPCIVEHAGLVLEGFENGNYPGGLTQPMWDALGAEDFVKSLDWAGKNAIARAVVGYCDGARVNVFKGETKGILTDKPRGDRRFYWDTIFCPDGGNGKTYSEIYEQQGIGEKMRLSQSAKAIKEFMQMALLNPSELYPE